MTKLEKNQLHTVTITGYSSEGWGIARIDGQVVFVHGGVRDETCAIRILKVLKHSAFARVETVPEPSPRRQAVVCDHYPACGGCDLCHLTYREELWFKRQKVEDALRRIGGWSGTVEEIVGSEAVSGYRNKSQFPVSAAGRIGFYRARSHEVIPATDCLLQTEAANRIAGAVEQYMAEKAVSGYHEESGKGLVRHVFVRTNRQGDALVCVVVNGNRLPNETDLVERIRQAYPRTIGIVLNRNTMDTNVVLGQDYRTLWGADTLVDTLCGLEFALAIPAFYQVNREQAERLYELAESYAQLTGEETVLDLYCGVGTITLKLAGAAKRVIGAEIVPEAIANARQNALRNGITNAEFICGDAGEAARRLEHANIQPDVVVVDPPRKGLDAEVIAGILRMNPKRVVYVSCDCATLARDTALFHGYTLEKAAAVDLFPRTKHVETVVLLSKGKISTEKIRVEFSMDGMDLADLRERPPILKSKNMFLRQQD